MSASSKKPNAESPAPLVITMAVDDMGASAAVVNVIGVIGWNEGEALSFRSRVEELINNGANKIIVRINSTGGAVWDALAMYDMLLACGVPVETEVCGCAASAASLLLMAGSRRAINANGRIMLHPAKAGIYGTLDEIRKFTGVLEEDQGRVWAIYAEKCGKSADEIIRDNAADTWYTAEEAMAYGLVTEIIKDVKVSNDATEEDTPDETEPDAKETESDTPEMTTTPEAENDDEGDDPPPAPAAEEEEDDDDDDDQESPSALSGITATLASLNKLGAAIGIKVFRNAARRRQMKIVEEQRKTDATLERLKTENEGLMMQIARLESENRALSVNLPKAAAAAAVQTEALQGVNVDDVPKASAAPSARLIDVPTTRSAWNALEPSEKISVLAQVPDILTRLK